MGLKIAEMSEFKGKPETLIETSYLGDVPKLMMTKGEAFFDVPNDTWKYRPFGQTTRFYNVEGEDLDCANDGGWLNGSYVGKKAINKVGKASWDEGEECWTYKPKGDRRAFSIPEDDFIVERDKDVF